MSKHSKLCIGSQRSKRDGMEARKTLPLVSTERLGKAGCIFKNTLETGERQYMPGALEGLAPIGTGTDDDVARNMKLCLQYFPSVRQLRISIYDVKGLSEKNCRLDTKVSLLGSKGQKKGVCSLKKAYVNSHSATFNENMYLKLRKEDSSKRYLCISLFESSTRRVFFKRSTTPIGGVVLSLDGLNLDLDTALEVKLTSPERLRKVINGKDIKISRSDTLEEQARKMVTESAYTPERSRSTDVIRSLPVFIQYGPTHH